MGGNLLTIPYGLERDILFFFQALAIFALAYAAFKMSQRSRETGFFSATMGLCILLVGIAGIQVTIFHALFFAEDAGARQSVLMVGDVFAMTGLACFVLFVEIDQAREIPGPARPNRSYGHSLITFSILAILILVIVLETIEILDSGLRFLLIFLEIFPATLAARTFLHRFKDLEIVRRTNAHRWFFAGLVLTGLSNFLPSLHLFLSFWVFGIASATIVVGGFLMATAWAHFPHLEDLQWLRNLDRLVVFENQGGIPLFEHAFRSETYASDEPNSSSRVAILFPSKKPEELNAVLAAGAMAGVDSLLGEVLASKGHVKEIDYGEKKAIFYRGHQAIFMLVVAAPSQESVYRLEMFGLSFERHYVTDFAKVNTDPRKFQGALSLMRKYFS